MRFGRRLVASGSVIAVLLAFVLGVVFAREDRALLINPVAIQLPQQAQDYLPKSTGNHRLVSPLQQKHWVQQFRQYYFMPWNKTYSPSNLQALMHQLVRQYVARPGMGMNFHRHSNKWILKIIENMNLSALTKPGKNAIIVQNTYLRALPTSQPSYYSFKLAGQGYPFDNLQVSSLWVGQPIKVMVISQNGEWALVVSSSCSGWIKTQSLAYVNQHFIKRYEQSQLVTVTTDDLPIKTMHNRFIANSKISQLFPIKHHQVFVPVMNGNQQAILVPVKLAKSSYHLFPLSLTAKNMSILINHLLGDPYGWGGFEHFRDCSLTQKDLFAVFGRWLPRNSHYQQHAGRYYNLSKMGSVKKRNFILKHAKPGLTLLGLNGHIILYLGHQGRKIFVFQTVWGVSTQDIFGDHGRDVIGKASITYLNVGKNLPHAVHPMIHYVIALTQLS